MKNGLKEKTNMHAQNEIFFSADRFASIGVGIGLPNIAQKSTFGFRNVQDGAERF